MALGCMVTRLYQLSQIYPAYPVTSRESNSSHLRLFPCLLGWSLGIPPVSWGPKSGILDRPLVLPFTGCRVFSAAWCWTSGLEFTLLLLNCSGYRFLLTGTMGLWGTLVPATPYPFFLPLLGELSFLWSLSTSAAQSCPPSMPLLNLCTVPCLEDLGSSGLACSGAGGADL